MTGKLSYEELEQRVKELEKEAVEYEKVKDALKLFSHSFESSRDGLAMGTRKNRISYVNEAFTKMFGYSREELMGKEIASLYADDQKLFLNEAIKITIKGGWTGELIGKKKDGTQFPVSISSSRVLDDKGNVITHMASHKDISREKQVLEALREKEATLQAILGASPIGIGLVKNRVIDWANKAMYRMVGYVQGALLGKSERVFYGSDKEYKRVGQELYESLAQSGIGRVETKWVRKDGTSFDCMIMAQSLDISDSSKGQIVSVTDTTDHKKAEKALKESEEKYRTILENMKEGYYEIDLAGNLTFFNKSICKMLGYRTDELYGMNNRECMDEKTARKTFKIFNKVYKTGRPKNIIDIDIIRKNGLRRNIESSASLVKDSKGNAVGFRGVFRDVTEHKQAEKALKKREAELEKVNKQLIETNRALSVLAKNLETTQKESEKRIIQRIRSYLIPVIEKLRQDRNIEQYKTDFDLLNRCIRDLSSELSNDVTIAPTLSSTELRVASLIRNGMSNKEIASQLYITPATVKTHRKNIRRKLDLHNSGIDLKSYIQSELGQG